MLLKEMRKQEMLRLQASALAEALIDTGETLPKAPRSAAGDGARLRGIPMIGGSGGAVPGTQPGTHGHLDRLDKRRRVSP
jgi:hypothetical protein